jgi:hypothetical protein
MVDCLPLVMMNGELGSGIKDLGFAIEEIHTWSIVSLFSSLIAFLNIIYESAQCSILRDAFLSSGDIAAICLGFRV